MSANILNFDVFAESGKGLMARPLKPDDVPCFQADINTIEYEIYNLTDPGSIPVTGSLDPAVVMSTTLRTWKYDLTGFSFLWAFPGNLWPLPGKRYRILVWFELKAPGTQFDNFVFLLAWEGKTTDPTS